MSIIDYRERVIAVLKDRLPALKDVQPHAGKFALEDFERLAVKAPAAYVAILAAPVREKLATGEMIFDAQIGVFIATRGSAGLAADKEGWLIAEAVAALAQWNAFNTAAFPADRVEVENLWSVDQDRNQVCIMGVGWCAGIKGGVDLTSQIIEIAPGPPAKLPVTVTVHSQLNGADAGTTTDVLS